MPNRARAGEQTNAPIQSLPIESPITTYHLPSAPDTMPSENVYIVREGETLAMVAEKFGVRDYALAKFNRLTDLTASLVGKALIIPAPISAAAVPKEKETAPVQTPPPPAPTRKAASEWDARLDALRVSIERAVVKEGEWFWKLARAEYLDAAETNSQHEIIINVRDENNAPVAKQTIMVETDEENEAVKTDEQGRVAWTLWAGYFPERGESGPYHVRVKGTSDSVRGLGLPSQNLASFRLTFQRTRK